MRVFAIVPAAGSSSRMGGQLSKSLLPLGAELVIERTLRILATTSNLSHIVLVVPERERASFEMITSPSSVPLTQILGGADRQQSVWNALCYLRETEAPAADDLVLIHDAARPMISRDLVGRCIDGARRFGAVTAGLPAIETIKRVDATGKVLETLPRAQIRTIQTPQVFRWEVLFQAHEQHRLAGATDDAGLVERIHPVQVVEGERWNLKLTTPEDYEILKALVALGISEDIG